MTEGLFFEPDDDPPPEGAFFEPEPYEGGSIEKYADPVHTHPSEVRYVSSGDSAASGDQIA